MFGQNKTQNKGYKGEKECEQHRVGHPSARPPVENTT
jgi:hypothetical protein